MKKHKYRIVIETQADGTKWFYVQQSFMRIFWLYETETVGMDMASRRIAWPTLAEAEKHIKKEIESREQLLRKKIVKREFVNPTT